MDKPVNPALVPPPPTLLKWLEPGALDKVMPRTLMARVSLTIVVPLILVQLISTYVFYDNHYDAMSRRMAGDLAGDVAAVQTFLEDFRAPEQRAWLTANTKHTMDLEVSFTEGATLPTATPRIDETTDTADVVEQALWQTLRKPFTIDTLKHRTDRLVAIQVQMQDGVLQILVPRTRIFGTNSTYVFVIWMVGSSMLLFGVATAYLRGQVRAVRRLAQAADNFGKGREVPDFPAEGAFEVRQAARAFNIMRDRIQRQISQRTDMLAGVSHDLRTPLTRMKLQLAMMANANPEDIAALSEDLGEMERMLESYLAFARGDGAEEAAPTDVAELLESVVGRFRREGAQIALGAGDLGQAKIKPVAFERCLGNLIGNAVRHGKNVAVGASRAGGVVEIHVDDDGPGIAPERREEAFRAFTRLEPSRNPKTGGIGLGLTIARDIVRSMGGDIALEASPLGGLRASVRIPL